MSVDILMTTYNGEKFLRNQILSLQQQTYKDWVLWIRDDGSSDNTCEIINDFSEADSRIRIVEIQQSVNLGPAKSFMMLTKVSSSQYAIFCDQDDVWFERKLEELVKFADEKFDSELPSLAYCDGYGYSDRDGVIILESISRAHAKNLKEFLFFNGGYQGCSVLFNKRLCNMMATYRAPYYYMHDDVLSMLAHSFGEVSFLPKRLMLYRQHDDNVTGAVQYGLISFLVRMFDRARPVISMPHFKEKKSFFSSYKAELSEEAKELYEAYFSYSSLGLVQRLLLIVKYRFSEGGNMIKLIVKTIVRRPIS